jgi:hypothetical protein
MRTDMNHLQGMCLSGKNFKNIFLKLELFFRFCNFISDRIWWKVPVTLLKSRDICVTEELHSWFLSVLEENALI